MQFVSFVRQSDTINWIKLLTGRNKCYKLSLQHKLQKKNYSVIPRKVILDLNKTLRLLVNPCLQMHQQYKIANLISKLNFYKLIPYPMDNMLNRSAQTSHCTHQVACRTSFLSRQGDVIASFSLSKPIRPLVN